MSDIVLSAGVRANLLQLQQTSDLITQTENRLATGKKVNSALDNAINFFTAQGLDNRANDLNGLLDTMSSGINTIQAANNGITAITKLVQSAQSLVSQAQQTTDSATLTSLSTQFDALLTQIGQLAGDSGFNGVNLLGGDTLTVTLDETGSSTTTVTGVDYTNANAAPLSIAGAANNWAERHRHHRGVRRSDRGAYLAAFGIADPELQPVGRADPPGLHQGDDQHAADRLRPVSPWPTRTRKAPTCSRCRPASSCRPPRCRSRRRPTRTCCGCSAKLRRDFRRKTAASGPPFFCAVKIMVNEFLTGANLTIRQP